MSADSVWRGRSTPRRGLCCAGLLGALEAQAIEEAPGKAGPAAAAPPAYEPPAESALLADGLIEPVR
jgi:hypothetical protein